MANFQKRTVMVKVDPKNKMLVTPKVRLSFPALMAPEKPKAGDDPDKKPQYSTILLVPKTVDLTPFKKALTYAIMETYGEKVVDLKNFRWNINALPEGFRVPIKDGDKKADWKGFPGNWYIRASTSLRKPTILGPNKKEITDAELIYGGCYAHVSMGAGCYKHMGVEGVKFYLNHVMKVADGERLGGGDAAADFAEITPDLSGFGEQVADMPFESTDDGFDSGDL